MKIRCLAISLLFVLLASAPSFGETARVVTRENAIRESCRFFAPIKVKVKYNDVLKVLSKEGDWFRVRFRKVEGCIHKSAVEEKTFSLSGLTGTKAPSASSDEVALAGKGFNPQVEKSYKQNHPNLDFGKVDMIEKYAVPEDSLRDFAKAGGLNLPQ
jgi:hypothetical protein